MDPKDYIPTPCHEDWNAMTGGQKRKFCAQCSTHVHDLTDYSEEEILALKVQNGGKLCGSFRLAKPLTLGAGIATLALASCQPKPVHTVGIIYPPTPHAGEEEANQTRPPHGDDSSASTRPTNENAPPSTEKIIPHQGRMLGKIAVPKEQQIPKPEQPPILLGEIMIDPSSVSFDR